MGVKLRSDCVQNLMSSQPQDTALQFSIRICCIKRVLFVLPSLWVFVPKCYCLHLLFSSPLYLCFSSHSLSPGQLRAPALETPLVRPLRPLPLLLQGSVLQLAWGGGRPSHLPFH